MPDQRMICGAAPINILPLQGLRDLIIANPHHFQFSLLVLLRQNSVMEISYGQWFFLCWIGSICNHLALLGGARVYKTQRFGLVGAGEVVLLVLASRWNCVMSVRL